MPTVIDSLQIEIQSGSSNAASGIDALAGSLDRLKKYSKLTTVTKNLTALSAAVKGFHNASGAASSLVTLASAVERLRGVKSIASITNNLTKLTPALKGIENINLGRAEEQLFGIASAVWPLTEIKTSGFASMVNGMAKIDKVTKELDDDKINAFAERVKKLNDLLGPLSDKMATIGPAFKAINTGAGKAARAVQSFDHGVNTSTLNLSSFIEVVRTAAQAVASLVQRFVEFLAVAIEWDGVKAQFGNAFGDQADEYYEKITRITDALRINKQAFMENSAMAASMLTGFGVKKEDAREMGLGYTELAYDIWAAYNNVYKTLDGADGAMAAIRSAIAGEVEPIRRAGFTIVESTLEQTAAQHGLNISIEKATEAQKSYLRYLTLVDQAHSKGVVGTFAREMNTAEGMMRTFSQQLKSLAQAFGSLFLPILTKVMPYFQAFVELLEEGVRMIAAFFGIKIQDIGETWNDYSTGVDSAVEGTEAVTGALGDAADAAKELKNATIGIDELNVISPKAASGSGSGGAGGDGAGGGFGGLDVESLWDESIFKNINDQVDQIKEKFKDWLPVISTIGTALGGLTMASFLQSVGDAMAEMDLLKKALATVGIATIEAVLVFMFADDYLEGGNLLNLIGEAIVTAASGYLLFKAWGAGGLVLALGISILAQVAAIKTSLADGAVDLSDTELWVQSIFTVITGSLGGLVLSKYTGFFAKEGFVIGLGVSVMLVLSAIRTGAVESGEIDTDSIEAWILEIGSVVSAGLAGKWLGSALYKNGGPAGALIGVTAGLALNLVGTVEAKGEDFGDSVSDWINVALTSVSTALTAGKLWTIVGPTVKTALAGLLPKIGAALTSALGGLGSVVAAIGGGWAVAAIAAVVGILIMAVVDYDFTEIGRKIGSGIGKAVKAIKDFAVMIGGPIIDGIKNAFAWCKENFTWENIKEFVGFIFDPDSWSDIIWPKMKEIAGNILGGLWQGLQDGWNNFWGNIGEFIDGFVQGFKDALGIASPSKVFIEIGKDIISGLLNPLDIDTIKNKLVDMWNAAKRWWDGKTELKTYTPAIGSIKDKVSSAWTTAKNWYDDKKAKFKEYTPSIGSIYEKAKERWDNARTWWDSKKTKMKEYTPSIGSIYEKAKERWDNARTWWNDKKTAMKTYTPSIGSIADKVKSAWNSAKDWWNRNVKGLSTKLDIKVPKITIEWTSTTVLGKKFKYPSGFDITFAADGGIFDAGSLIWAGERGAEVVANAGGGKTGVMNIEQMQEAVYEGVYAAMTAAMSKHSSGGTQGVNVYLDSRQITSTVEQRQREKGASIMGNEVFA